MSLPQKVPWDFQQCQTVVAIVSFQFFAHIQLRRPMPHQNDQGIPPRLTKSRLLMGRPRSQRRDWHWTQQRYEEESPRHAQKTQGVDSVQQTKLPPEPVALRGDRAKCGVKINET